MERGGLGIIVVRVMRNANGSIETVDEQRVEIVSSLLARDFLQSGPLEVELLRETMLRGRSYGGK